MSVAVEQETRSLVAKLRHALSWRIERIRNRTRERLPQFVPVLLELRKATGRNIVDLANEMREARRSVGLDAEDFAAYMLWNVPRERWREYVVGDELEAFLRRTLDPDDRLLSRDKAAFAQADGAKGLPWLRTLAVINRREGVTIDGAIAIEDEAALWPALDRLREAGELVVKPSCGERGQGFFGVSANGCVRDESGHEVAKRVFARSVLTYAHALGRYGYLVQPALSPHPDMVRLTGIETLSTVRIVTALKDGEPHVIESFLKIPGPGRLTDNFLSGLLGTKIARFDAGTGVLADAAGLMRPGFRHVLEARSVHPVTRKQIGGQTLPFWREALEVAFRAARSHPRTPTMGWDVALSSRGCVILDGNPNWGPGWEPCAPRGVRALMLQLYPADFEPVR